MSNDLAFWRPEGPITGRPVDTYRRLAQMEPVDGVAELSAEAVKAAFLAEFSDLKEEGPALLGPGFSVIMEPPLRAVIVTCSWKLAARPDVLGKILRAGREGLGCCSFDPQSGAYRDPVTSG
ncbi:hypothetical protein J8F10_10310 [Gemmata sp. G18]|uniref:Uncharacterized protein n=1 Tax=Gemmata palustris TaxID=2822762 RepID=A0ABS5BPR3_9BACT|nr:hypothetical protein [Gemmata palustris]MBP3955673.1 hypothetical protein [Gemmata palustris]